MVAWSHEVRWDPRTWVWLDSSADARSLGCRVEDEGAWGGVFAALQVGKALSLNGACCRGSLGLPPSLAAWDLNFPRKTFFFLLSQLRPVEGPLHPLLWLTPRHQHICSSWGGRG